MVASAAVGVKSFVQDTNSVWLFPCVESGWAGVGFAGSGGSPGSAGRFTFSHSPSAGLIVW